jgi:hypothetical protein
MTRQLWQLLLDEPTELNCEECFALMECYAEVLTSEGDRLLPQVLEHLKSCPHCALQHREALHRLAGNPSEGGEPPGSGPVDGDAQPRDRGATRREGPWKSQSA